MGAAKVQASLRIRAVSSEPSLLAHRSSESRGTFRQKARSLASLNGWAWAVKICHDRMLEDTNSLDGAPSLITERRLTCSKVTEFLFWFQPFDKCFIGGSDEGDADHMFSGQLSTMYLFSEAMSSAQVASLYELGPSYKVGKKISSCIITEYSQMLI